MNKSRSIALIVWGKLVMNGEVCAHLLENEDAANGLLDSVTPGIRSILRGSCPMF